ncbi:16S rRNA (guanine(966)-N(2))-methyltransferase RsmD [Thermaurantiacus sp.]
MIRIIAGTWRSRKLESPPGLATRPTASRTRETLFAMLASRLGSFEGLFVLDLFAGSGALGLEALSRGALHATFVEVDPRAAHACEANIARLGAVATLMRHDATRLPPAPRPFDLLLLDPPYGQGLADAALASALMGGWIAPHALIACETGRSEPLAPAGFATLVERPVGKAMLHLLAPLPAGS